MPIKITTVSTVLFLFQADRSDGFMNNNQDKGSEGIHFSSSQNNETRGEAVFVHFIGDNAGKYIPKFRQFSVNGVDKFVPTWHWPACFFSYIWIAYRKMYRWAIAAFVLEGLFSFVYFNLLGFLAGLLNPYLGEILPVLLWLPLKLLGIVSPLILFGITGNYLYYKHAKDKIIECMGKLPSSDTEEFVFALQKTGGVNFWAAILAILIPLAISVVF